MSTEGKIPIQADIIPANANPRMPVTDTRYVKGSPQVFATIEELVAFHPNITRQGVPMTIMNYPSAGIITEFKLNTDPALLIDSSNNSIITLNNFRDFYDIANQTQTSKSRVYQYAPDGPGGGAPIYPYTVGEESNWVNEFDRGLHKWIRFRDDDVDDNSDDIFDNWTVPIPANNAFSTGDYIENRYRRQNVSAVDHVAIGTLTSAKYYVIEEGQLDITGDVSLNDIGIYATASQTVVLSIGRIFKYVIANVYNFNGTAHLRETVAAPPRVVAGATNDDPVGWTDTIPVGSEQLWEITGQKSIYGKLKSDWIVRKINEDPNFIRYNTVTIPHPDTLVDTTTSAVAGSPGDTDLLAEGWESVYNQQEYMAQRSDLGGGTYSIWTIKKISNESGEFKDRVFKLFDQNLDLNDPILVVPITSDPIEEGFSDAPLAETDTKINYVTEAIRFFDRTLKTPWSPLVPYTGKSVYIPAITTDLGDNFKYDQDDNVTPSQIKLTAELYRGAAELWLNTDLVITYAWNIVFNGNAVVDIDPTTNPADNFYLLATSGTPGNANYIRTNQQVILKPDAVDGNAVIRCIQTIAMDQGDDLVFTTEFSVLDVTDGKDARILVVSADNDRIIYDTVNTVFIPANIVLRAYNSNLVSPTYYWYRWNGASWTAIASGGGYSIVGNTLTITSVTPFALNNTAQEQRYAVSTHATNPDSADYAATFSDFITIAKLSSAGVGTAGADSLSALLSNEAHTIVLDSNTGSPITGEIGLTGKALATLSVYEGLIKLVYGGGNDYTIAVASDDPGVTFAFVANGNDVNVYVSVWTANERSANCTITITYGAIILQKTFSISSTQDAPGAIILDVDSDKGFTFTPADKTNKTFTAKLYDTSQDPDEIALPDAQYEFRWKIAGVWTSLSTTPTKVVTRANILVSSIVTVEAYKDSVLFRSRNITVTDVNDGKIYRAWTTNSAKPSSLQDLSNQDPTIPSGAFGAAGNTVVIVSGVSWYLATATFWATNSPKWAQDAEFISGVPTWGAIYQIRGEEGSQGNEGGFPHYMYKVLDSAVPPPFGSGGNTSSLAQMQAAGWQSLRPASGVIWQTTRYWNGQGVTFNGAGDPSTLPKTGSIWQPPIRLSAKDGLAGGAGSIGNKGWSPNYALVARGTSDKVLQLISWVGGEGTPPAGAGQFLGTSGLTSDINAANNISGVPVTLRFDNASKTLQWKYVGEADSEYRNLVTFPQVTSTMSTISGNNSNVQISIASAPYRRKFTASGFVETMSPVRFKIKVVVSGGATPSTPWSNANVQVSGSWTIIPLFGQFILEAGISADISLFGDIGVGSGYVDGYLQYDEFAIP